MTTENDTEGVLNIAKENLRKGEYKETLINLNDALQANPKLQKAIQELITKTNSLKNEEVITNKYMENKKYKNALAHIDSILIDVSDCPRVRILKAECFAHMNDYLKAKAAIKEIEDGNKNPENALTKIDIEYVKALIDFNEGRLKSALEIITKAWEKDKCHPKVKQLFFRVKYLQNQIDEAERAVQQNNYQQAQVLYSEVADIINEDNKNGENNRILAGILKSKAETSLKMKAYIDVIADCERVINYRAYLAEAYSYLADAHMATGGADVVIKLFSKELENKALDVDTRKIIEKKLEVAKDKKAGEPLKKLQNKLAHIKSCKTPREIAEVSPDTSIMETVKSLTKLLSHFSSDHFKTEAQKTLAGEIFKLVSEARENVNNEDPSKQDLNKLKQFRDKLLACKTPQEMAEMQDTAEQKDVLQKLKKMVDEYKIENFTVKEQRNVVQEILNLLNGSIEKLDLEDYMKLLERLRNCKTARQVAEMPEDAAKKDVVKKLKHMFKTYHPDQVKGEMKKEIAGEIFKCVQNVLQDLIQEK